MDQAQNPSFKEDDFLQENQIKNIDKLDIKHVDIVNALVRVQNDQNILFNMLERFSNSQKDTMKIVSEDIKLGNIKDAKREVHTLKGLCGSLEAKDIYSELQKLESKLKEDIIDNESVSSAVTDIDKKVSELISSIDENLVKFKSELRENNLESDASMDIKEIYNRIYKLKELLQNLDSDAIESANELVRILNNHVSKDKLNSMSEFVANFDFEEAVSILEDILQEFGIDIDKREV